MTDDMEKEIERRVQEELAKVKTKPKKRKKVKLPTILTDEQVQSILDWFNEDSKYGYRNKTYILFLLRNALRANEAKHIRWEDITIVKDSEGNDEAVYRLLHNKSGFEADIPISKDTYERFVEVSRQFGNNNKKGYIFQTGQYNKLMQGSYFRRVAGNIGKELGFHFNLHQLRHFTLSKIYNKTQNIKLVQLTARHSSIASSEPYIHLNPAAVRGATELIDF
jgi:integrase